MSILRTYGRSGDVFGDPDIGSRWPLYRLSNEDWSVDKEAKGLAPGDWVCHINGGGTGRGIVVAINDDEVAVLWSIDPQELDFSKFTMPIIKKAPPGGLFQQSNFRLQPMSVPSGAVFYLDYKYGNKEPEAVDPVPSSGPRLPKKAGRSPRRPGRPTRGPRKNP